MPNFDRLLDFDVDIQLPDIDLSFDVDLFDDFSWLKWDCAVQVNEICDANSGEVTFDCTQSLSSYQSGGGSAGNSGGSGGSGGSTPNLSNELRRCIQNPRRCWGIRI